MKLYFYGFIMILKKFIFRENTGKVIRWFASKMGVTYIKFAQMLAMQNYGNLFTENDRVELSYICDNCNPIKFKKIKKIIEREYSCKLSEKFISVSETPVGSASISQVHKAVLKNGEKVALKIKRKDVAKKINKDIKQIKKIVRRYGKIFKFNNYLGSDNALDMFLEWIIEETNFNIEKENIKKYQQFSSNVNSKVDDTVKIKVPKIYEDLCTDDIIVMEFIEDKTVNNLELNYFNKERIAKCLDDYLKLSFYALFNNKEVVFHGDPHSGNIYIDSEGNIGFLDMGLIFSFTSAEAEFIKKLFFFAYNGNYQKLTNLILEHSDYTNIDIDALTNNIKECSLKFKKIPVTEFFVEMINVFTKFNVKPSNILFKLAKSFIALYGINNYIGNEINAEELLTNQIIEYYVNRCFNDFKDIFDNGINLIPNFIKTTLKKGIVKSISEQLDSLYSFNRKMTNCLNNFEEVRDFFSK